MKWEETRFARGGKVLFLRDEKGRTWQHVADGISACLLRICSELPAAMESETWDRLISEVWFDSGRVIFLPSKKGSLGKPPYIVQFLSSLLQKEFEAIPNEEVNPKFTRDVLNLRHKIFQAFGASTDNAEVNHALQDLRKLNECRLFFQFGSDEDTRQELFVVWQKRKK